jgi:hypothetical protein
MFLLYSYITNKSNKNQRGDDFLINQLKIALRHHSEKEIPEQCTAAPFPDLVF